MPGAVGKAGPRSSRVAAGIDLQEEQEKGICTLRGISDSVCPEEQDKVLVRDMVGSIGPEEQDIL